MFAVTVVLSTGNRYHSSPHIRAPRACSFGGFLFLLSSSIPLHAIKGDLLVPQVIQLTYSSQG